MLLTKQTLAQDDLQLRSFIIPRRHERYAFNREANVCAVLPTYTPNAITLKLVEDLLRSNSRLLVYIVDDCTPRERTPSIALFNALVSLPRVTVLRTPVNKLKAGALNLALKYIFASEREYVPDVILTLDDDVAIAPDTVKNLVFELMTTPSLGAVCSQCRVYNKNKNLLTRLQGLEYAGFNAIRLADEGFLRGPLVMHGMLTAFRAVALREVRGFFEGHLIEDYEVTTRLKDLGWSVKSAQNAPAWTVVPEKLSTFWRQRTRWSYGGLTVVAGSTRASSVFQDVLGHTLFLATISLVVALLLSQEKEQMPSHIAEWIIALAFLQLGLWYAFQLWIMRFYDEKDTYDWLIRIALIPEFIYGHVMTTALIGSYSFFLFNVPKKFLLEEGGVFSRMVLRGGSRLFFWLGYREGSWGTRI